MLLEVRIPVTCEAGSVTRRMYKGALSVLFLDLRAGSMCMFSCKKINSKLCTYDLCISFYVYVSKSVYLKK